MNKEEFLRWKYSISNNFSFNPFLMNSKSISGPLLTLVHLTSTRLSTNNCKWFKLRKVKQSRITKKAPKIYCLFLCIIAALTDIAQLLWYLWTIVQCHRNLNFSSHFTNHRQCLLTLNHYAISPLTSINSVKLV